MRSDGGGGPGRSVFYFLQLPERSGEIISTKYDMIINVNENYMDYFEIDKETVIYKLKDGTKAKVVVQYIIEDSGPMVFRCLEINGVQQYQWTEEEIQKEVR